MSEPSRVQARSALRAALLLAQAEARNDGPAFVEAWTTGIEESGFLFVQAVAGLPTVMADQIGAKLGISFDLDVVYAETLRGLAAEDN